MAKSLKQVETYWSKHAATFDQSPDHGLLDPVVRAAWRARLASWMPSEPGVVADLGCGTGSLSLLAAELGADVQGIDLSPAMIDIARQKAIAGQERLNVGGDLRFDVGDASDPSIDPGSIDVVLSRHLLWTLPDPASALHRWARLLRPEGRLILIEGVWGTRPVEKKPGSAAFPWDGGVSAARLLEQVKPLVDDVTLVPLSDASELWGKTVDDERYAVIAQGPHRCGSDNRS